MSERGQLESTGKKLAAELGVEFAYRGLSTDDIRAKVGELQAQAADRNAVAERESEITKKAAAAKLEALNSHVNEYRGGGLKFSYQVAPGKHLKCRFGVLKSGARVAAEYVGGEKRLADLVEAGAVLKRA